jgi:hypothetical protein
MPNVTFASNLWLAPTTVTSASDCLTSDTPNLKNGQVSGKKILFLEHVDRCKANWLNIDR